VTAAVDIYGEAYARNYGALYIDPWRAKHALNVRNLEELLSCHAGPMPAWLDLACGQAWHFRQLPGKARMTGLDLSEAQLRQARLHATDANFVCADVLRPPFAARSFDLVTNFWAGYCYLGGEVAIGSFLDVACSLLRPGGALYLEVLLAEDLASFNLSNYAARTGFRVEALTADYVNWAYDDHGGRHVMTSPPLAFFEARLAGRFAAVQCVHDGGFLVHLRATGNIA
jgi:predicted TPR repeat methyltransferase